MSCEHSEKQILATAFVIYMNKVHLPHSLTINNPYHVKCWESSVAFDLHQLLHAVSSISKEGLHGFTGSFREHLAQTVQLSIHNQRKQQWALEKYLDFRA